MRTVLATLHSKFIHASLALPSLAAYCGAACGELVIHEFTVHEPRESVLAALLAAEPDVVAFSVYLWNRRETLALIDALSVARPGLRTLVGGPEVSFAGSDLFARHPGLSALVRGEGEIPLRGLLAAWNRGENPGKVPRLSWRLGESVIDGPEGPPLADLDAIPSPFQLGLIDLTRGFVYYETSRGCPYRCSFCMSARDPAVRSFSLDRIRADLDLLMARRVSKIKLVDRTFNYDAARARAIFQHILANNRSSHFHFEIGAHLLDEQTLELLRIVPPDTFQFEIGVQSTLPATLSAIDRSVSLGRLEENVRRLREMGNIHLHLDLIAGLPGEDYSAFLRSIDRVAALRPHHLQIEPVKLLPGAPLRERAAVLNLRFDPSPPYTVLGTPDLSFFELERLRGIGRLLDLTGNAGRLQGFLAGLTARCGSLSSGLEQLEEFWREHDLFRFPLSQRGVFEHLGRFVAETLPAPDRNRLRDLLARDFARSERVVPGNAPPFFDQNLAPAEAQRVRDQVRRATEAARGNGIKIQFFAAAFHFLPELDGRSVILFIYRTAPGQGFQVEEIVLSTAE